MAKAGGSSKPEPGKLTVKKQQIKDLDVKAGKAGAVKGGGGTTGCSLTFKSTGKSSC